MNPIIPFAPIQPSHRPHPHAAAAQSRIELDAGHDIRSNIKRFRMSARYANRKA